MGMCETEINRPTGATVEVPSHVSMGCISEMAQTYILEGPEEISTADLYLANKALVEQISTAREKGLTPKDVVVALLSPIFNTKAHCKCPSCRGRCRVCRHVVEQGS